MMRALLSLSLCLCAIVWPAMAATPDEPLPVISKDAPPPSHWRVDGGEMRLRFNDDFLDLFGIRAQLPKTAFDATDPEYSLFSLRPGEGLSFNAPEGGFDRFVGGSLKVAGGFRLVLDDGAVIDQHDITLRVNPDNPLHIDLVGADGMVWLYFNHLMYKMIDDERMFYVRSADLRATPALAKRVGHAPLADAYVGEMRMSAHVVSRGEDYLAAPKCAAPNFHGNPLPGGGGTYQADVLMESYAMSFSRCRRENLTNGCDGAGPDNGQIVFTPSATLRNSDTDTTADVPWYRKFTVSPYNYPYTGNDQHPYLIWNLYRIVDGQLEQIGASGVKHAFLTINTGCAPGACTASGHILGRRCGDTYGTGNNDSNSDLGPRHELIPSTGVWGRCGSIYDPGCTGSNTNPTPNTSYDSRLTVRESQLGVAGAQYFSESWYIVQDDVNIYNTMARRTLSPAPNGSGGWSVGSQGAQSLGPVINAWVDPVAFPTRNIEFDTPFGHARVAVRAVELDSCPPGSGLSGTCYRYDYAVNNFDYSVATTSGTLPNLTVTSNHGFDRFSVSVPADVGVFLQPGAHFADLDIDAGNNWTPTLSANAVTWEAPDSDSELSWGTLYRFSFVADIGPSDEDRVTVTLRPGSFAGGAVVLNGEMTGPGDPSRIYGDGFESK